MSTPTEAEKIEQIIDEVFAQGQAYTQNEHDDDWREEATAAISEMLAAARIDELHNLMITGGLRRKTIDARIAALTAQADGRTK